MKKLSVIIPVYCSEKYLPRPLNSLLRQTYPNIEVVIVDDCTPGDIKQYIVPFQKEGMSITVIRHDVNRGSYRARITGVEHASGEYLAFLDSDDCVSLDYYRCLIQSLEGHDADIAVGEYANEDELTGGISYYNFDAFEMMDSFLESQSPLDAITQQKGLCHSWHLMWNKVFTRSLWDRCYPIMNALTERVVMCDDVISSVALFSQAKRLCVSHGERYFYLQRKSASTGQVASFQAWKSKVDDTYRAFDYVIHTILGKCDDIVRQNMTAWRSLLASYWYSKAVSSHMSAAEIQSACILLNDLSFPLQISYPKEEQGFFYSESTPAATQLYQIKEKICKADTVSFDIFDTLVVRPMLDPTDLFRLAAHLLHEDEREFINARIECERLARDKNDGEITLDGIYDTIKSELGWDSAQLNRLKAKETELELSLCYPRSQGHELYDLARSLGKAIWFTSDMYLSIDVISQILRKCGYLVEENIVLSSVHGTTKATGQLYSALPRDCLHIGDNYGSDVIKAHAAGLRTAFFPSTQCAAQNQTSLYTGNFFRKLIDGYIENKVKPPLSLGVLHYLGICQNAIYDNPFQEFHAESLLNGNPRWIGPVVLGTFWIGFLSSVFQRLGTKPRTLYFPQELRFVSKLAGILLGGEDNVVCLPFSTTSLLILAAKQNPKRTHEIALELPDTLTPQIVRENMESIPHLMDLEQYDRMLEEANLHPNSRLNNHSKKLSFLHAALSSITDFPKPPSSFCLVLAKGSPVLSSVEVSPVFCAVGAADLSPYAVLPLPVQTCLLALTLTPSSRSLPQQVCYQTQFVHRCMEDATYSIVTQFSRLFCKFKLPFDSVDASLPLQVFCENAHSFDRKLFAHVHTEDNQAIPYLLVQNAENVPLNKPCPTFREQFLSSPRWKRVLTMLLLDQKTLIEKLKHKLHT